MKVEFYKHNVDAVDIENVNRVLKGIFLTTGEWVDRFEKNLAEYVGAKCGVGVTSCTEALRMALMAYGIGKGDEVITTALSFIATANATEEVGAKPVFVDIEENTGNIDAELIEKAITKKTKAIMPVHLYGQLCDMKKIRAIAQKYKLVVVEDAAHALESKRDGYRTGELGDMTCYSFYATKNITCGEGGALTLNDPKKAEWLKRARLHGMGKGAADRYKLKKFQHQTMEFLGLKANMSNIQAALLIHQLDKVEERLKKREQICQRYEKALRDVKEIEQLEILPGVKSARHLFVIKAPLQKRDEIVLALQQKNVGAVVNYLPIHLMKYYREKYGYKKGDFPKAEDFGARVISLPCYPKLTRKEQDYVVEMVEEVFGK